MTARAFTDKKGRNWDVSLTLGGARRIDASDFSEVTSKRFSILRPDKHLLSDILTDTPLLFAIIWALVQPQAQASGVDEAEFLDGLDGPSIQAGREAFWEALSDFFPEHATALSTLLSQYQKAGKRIAAELAAMETEIEAVVSEEVATQTEKLRKELRAMTRSGSPGATSSP